MSKNRTVNITVKYKKILSNKIKNYLKIKKNVQK